MTEAKELRKIRSVTRWLFVSGQIAAIVWVSTSYAIAAYATIALREPFPVVDLSQQAITTIIAMGGYKILENVFEHGVFRKKGADANADL